MSLPTARGDVMAGTREARGDVMAGTREARGDVMAGTREARGDVMAGTREARGDVMAGTREAGTGTDLAGTRGAGTGTDLAGTRGAGTGILEILKRRERCFRAWLFLQAAASPVMALWERGSFPAAWRLLAVVWMSRRQLPSRFCVNCGIFGGCLEVLAVFPSRTRVRNMFFIFTLQKLGNNLQNLQASKRKSVFIAIAAWRSSKTNLQLTSKT